MLDPNWLYSSLAQCAAALVGLIGAVLATRLQTQIALVRDATEKLSLRLRELRDSPRDVIARLGEFERFASQRIPALEEAIRAGQNRIEVNRELDIWGNSRGGSGMWVPATSEAIDQLKAQVAILPAMNGALDQCSRLRTPQEARALRGPLEAVLSRIPSERAYMIRDYLDRLTLVERAHDLSDTAASVRVPAVMTAILGWLTVLGLVFPLAYLSSYSSSHKILLLTAFSIGISAVPVYIAIELVRIKKLAAVDLSRAA